MAKAFAIHLAKSNIRVNCICPYLADTPMGPAFVRVTPDEDKAITEEKMKQFSSIVPMGRLAEPKDVAHAALFLASDESSYITGVAFPVDGGYTAK